MWKWISSLFTSSEPQFNAAGELITDARDRTYKITCGCCEMRYYVTGRKVKRCVSIPGFKAECPLCGEVNFFDRKHAVG